MNNNSFETSSICGKNEGRYRHELKKLAVRIFQENRVKYPTVPDDLLPRVTRSDRTKPALRQCIYDHLRLDGYPVNISHNSKHKLLFDIETTLNDRCFYILAVPGVMVQNHTQYRFQQKVERQGAGYFTVKSFGEFLMVIDTILGTAPAQTVAA